jgi:uncharacterized protein (TIGR03067 family)
MNRIFIASFVLIALHTAYADDNPPTGDLARLQGVWKGTTGKNGQFQTMMTLKGQSGVMENTTPQGDKIGLTYKFEIDGKANPKRIHMFDIVRFGGNRSGSEEVHGIYRFVDDDTVEICNRFDGEYPTEFKRDEQGNSTLFTLKRNREAAQTGK